MLVSHNKGFIFTKTVKTAGTTVESYFEPWCMTGEAWEAADARREHVSEAGIVGSRSGSGLELQTAVWWNHMPAETIRALLGRETWDRYFKFTVVRNPFDQMVSAYRFFHASRRWAGSIVASVKRQVIAPARARGHGLQADFERWLETLTLPLDRNKYVIDGELCVDHVIRFEALGEGVAEVCERLDIEFDESRLGHFKRSKRPKTPVESYYSDHSVAMVATAHDFELEEFGYSVPW